MAGSSPASLERERAHGAFGLVVVGISIAIWWPCFTLGAWGELFFDQLLTVWVAATAGLIVVLVQPRSMGRRWSRIAALAVPSVWLLLAFIDDAQTADLMTDIVTLLGIVIGVVGIPFTLWTLSRVLWPDLFAGLRLRARVGVAAIVVLIGIASLLLGAAQERFLTCQDFEVSGNSRPPGCVPTTGPDETNPG